MPAAASHTNSVAQRWQRSIDAGGLRSVHRENDGRSFQIRRALPSDDICTAHSSLPALITRLRGWASFDLWNDTVIRSDVEYAVRTCDDAFLLAEIDGRPQWNEHGEGAGGYLAHKRHCDTAERLGKQLTDDDLARAAALRRQFAASEWGVLQRVRREEALAEQSAAELKAAMGLVSAPALRRRL